MTTRLSALAMAGALVLAAPALLRASDYPIDLATHTGDITVSVSPGRIRPVVLHRLPGRRYLVEIVVDTVPVPALALPTGITIPDGTAALAINECATLKADVEAVGAPKDEIEVGVAATKIAQLLTATTCGAPGGVPDPNNVVGQARQMLEKYANSQPFDEYDLRSGQRLTVRVRRLDASGSPEKSWSTVLTTGSRGEWLTSYAFAFAPLRDDLYKLVAGEAKTGESVKYTITRQRDDEDSGDRFIPAVMFSWLPSRSAARALSVSPTGGVGVSANSPAFLLGFDLRYNTNLAFVAGGAYAQQRRLSRAYEPGEIITTNLPDDQLHDKAWRRTWFMGFSLRFGANPFKAAAGSEAAEPAGDPKKTTPTAGTGTSTQEKKP